MCSSAPAHAQALADQGHIILSAERISPLFSYTKRNRTIDNVSDDTTTSSTFGFFWNPNANTAYADVPRFALDYTVIPKLTVGGAFYMFFTGSATSESKTGATTVSVDGSKLTVLGIAPRVGYVVAISEMFAFWPRFALSFTSASLKSPPTTVPVNTETSTSVTLFAAHLEPMFVVTPVPHAGITFGPVLDVPLTGGLSTETRAGNTTTSRDGSASELHFGLTAGLLAYF